MRRCWVKGTEVQLRRMSVVLGSSVQPGDSS